MRELKNMASLQITLFTPRIAWLEEFTALSFRFKEKVEHIYVYLFFFGSALTLIHGSITNKGDYFFNTFSVL